MQLGDASTNLNTLRDGTLALLGYVFEHGWESDFSFAGVDREYSERFGAIHSKPLSPEEEEKARTLLEHMEASRKASIAQYEKDGLPPFMRSRAPALESGGDSDAEPT
jgi:hypothetical protein